MLQRANRGRYIVDGAEAFAVIGESMMESTAQVDANAIAQCFARGQNGAAAGQPETLHHLLGVWNFEPQDLFMTQGARFQPLHPTRVVHAQHILVRYRLRLQKIQRMSKALVQKAIAEERG